ncbi:MAG: PIN domain-containing protein [Nitrospirae bacterium]|nr:PIN domain-containing protein [Nitrospirota bacterium]MBF0536294.1 PIN domain-containing protein [Nitrospirota bacterium]MBF0618216.1 PIN domain-containing protein [Nitrospirota bacterium]
MTDRLIDTNILVYAYDISEGEKHMISKAILKQIWEEGGGVVCLQNLMEFYVVITKKVKNPIGVNKAKTIIKDFLQSENWIVIDRDEETFLKAIDLVSQYNIHFWDATIATCMIDNDISEIITENKRDFEKIPDINITVPF